MGLRTPREQRRAAVAGEMREVQETYDGLIREIRTGRWATYDDLLAYLRSDDSTYVARMVYFAGDAWKQAHS